MSLMAKVREESVCLAEGGGGWGKGSSSKRSIKAPKSCLGLFRRRLLRRVSDRTTIPPASPSPTINQSLGLEACCLMRFNDCDMVIDQRKCEEMEKLGLEEERMGFGRVLLLREEFRILGSWRLQLLQSLIGIF